jgi:hypothetical protein
MFSPTEDFDTRDNREAGPGADGAFDSLDDVDPSIK